MAGAHNFVRVMSTFFLVHPSRAWPSTAKMGLTTRNFSRGHRALSAAPSPIAALPHRDGTQLRDDEPDARGLDLNAALEAAREADRRYGLCTPASTRAWKLVDEIYFSSKTSQRAENNVTESLGGAF